MRGLVAEENISLKRMDNMSELNAVLDKLHKTDERVDRISEELAKHQPVADLIKYLLMFWAAISAILGLFGWSKFSDLDALVQEQVRLQLPKEQQEFADFKNAALEARKLSENYKILAGEYEQSVAAIKFSEKIGPAFDIEGEISRLMLESTSRNEELNEETGDTPNDYKNTILEPEWRKQAISTLQVFKERLATKSYPADFIFNVTQICRRLKQFQLAEELTTAAFQKDPTPPITALYYSSLVSNALGEEREAAFKKLMKMVASLPENSPHIVLAEAWNAAENERRYSDLIGAIDSRIEAGGSLPSYLYVIKAQSLLRQSHVDSVKDAQIAQDAAISLLQEESALSQWFESSLREYQKNQLVIEKSKQTKMAVDQISELMRMLGGSTNNNEQLTQ